jgi:AcrR family transcriptional regulator
MRATGEETKAEIRRVALQEFAMKGYDGVPLEEIGSQIGITRSAVLHHFGSKAELLREIVEPFEAMLDVILDAFADDPVPLPRTRRKQLLAKLVDGYSEHRLVLLLLMRDVSSHWPLHISPRMSFRIDRVVHLLAGEHPSAQDRVVVDAALGSITRPMIDPGVDTESPDNRALMLAIATDVARRLGR